MRHRLISQLDSSFPALGRHQGPSLNVNVYFPSPHHLPSGEWGVRHVLMSRRHKTESRQAVSSQRIFRERELKQMTLCLPEESWLPHWLVLLMKLSEPWKRNICFCLKGAKQGRIFDLDFKRRVRFLPDEYPREACPDRNVMSQITGGLSEEKEG